MRLLTRLLLNSLVALTLVLASASPAWAETKVHIVQPGETLFRISLQYGVTVQALQAANNLSGNLIFSGQALIIPDPAASTPPAAPTSNPPAAPPDQSASTIHIVERGETLFLIGLKYGLTWTAIQAANNLPGTTVYAGQRLIIPNSAAAPAPTTVPEQPTPAPTDTSPTDTPPPAETPVPEQPATPAPSFTHIVQRGETLFLIGLQYGLEWTTIQRANNLPDTTVYVGQELIIPNGSGSGPGAPSDPLAGIVVPIPPPAKTPDEKRFLVDLSDQRLYAYEGDTLVRTTLISSGLPQFPTVIGTYYIYLRYAAARMRGPGYDLPDVPFVMYFYQSYGLHGTYWHNNFGHPMSHGCVNMPTAEAEWAYNWSTYGTPVIIQP